MANEVLKGAKIHHVALKVSDFEKSLKFYTDLGFKVVASWDNAVMLDIGDGTIVEMFGAGKCTNNLREVYGNMEKPDVVVQKDAGEFFHLAINVDDVTACFNKAISVGAVATKHPIDTVIKSNPHMPITVAFVLGPDGESIEFFKNR